MSNKPEFHYKAGELIEILKNYPPDLPVLVSGYESGYENFYEPRVVELTHKPENMHWDGEFQQPDKDDSEIFMAVVLDRVSRSD